MTTVENNEANTTACTVITTLYNADKDTSYYYSS